MINATESKIVISMKHIDHANKLSKCLERIRILGAYGGDLDITCNGEKFFIGHDVTIRKVDHIIKEK